MKKLLITLLFCVTTFSVFAQKKVSWGVKGGVNIGELKNDYYDSDKDYGVVFGILVELPLQNNFSILGELNYYTHHSKDDFVMYGVGKFDRFLDFKFIQLPVIIKFNILNNLSLETGLALNYLIKEEANINLPSPNMDYTTSGQIKKYHLNGVIGSTYSLKNGFLVGIRFQQSIGNVYNEKWSESGQKLVSTQFFIGKSF